MSKFGLLAVIVVPSCMIVGALYRESSESFQVGRVGGCLRAQRGSEAHGAAPQRTEAKKEAFIRARVRAELERKGIEADPSTIASLASSDDAREQ